VRIRKKQRMNTDPNKSPFDPHKLALLVLGFTFLICGIIECGDFLHFKWEHSECRKAWKAWRDESAAAQLTPQPELNPKPVAAIPNEADKLAHKKAESERRADLTVGFKLPAN
jgi:hypothetical protein